MFVKKCNKYVIKSNLKFFINSSIKNEQYQEFIFNLLPKLACTVFYSCFTFTSTFQFNILEKKKFMDLYICWQNHITSQRLQTSEYVDMI